MSEFAATTVACIVAVSALFWSSPAPAHHSGAVFDLENLKELRGTLVAFKLRSPHASLIVDAQVFSNDQALGEMERWEIEWESVPVLRSLGIDTDTFEPGDTLTMKVAPHRDPEFKFAHAVAIIDAFGSEYVTANSKRLFSPSLRAAAGAAPQRSAGAELAAVESPATVIARLQGRWQQPLRQPAGDNPGLPLNAAGMAAWRNYDRTQSPANTCEPINVPDIFFSAFFLFELRLDERKAVLHNEYYDIVRTVPLNGSSAAADARGRFGNVTGHIDGAALVVESRGFPASNWGLGIEEMHGADIPSSTSKIVTESFAVTPDGRTLIYQYTLADPMYMTGPHSGRVELTRVPDEVPFYPFDCDLESAAMWSRHRGDAPLRIERAR